MATRKRTPPPAPPPEEPDSGIEIIEVVDWQGIKIDAHYRSRYCGAPHLELHVIDPPLAPIPVSDTGYRSHFHGSLPTDIEQAGGLTAYVTAWLDHEAQGPQWKKAQGPKQLDLFA